MRSRMLDTQLPAQNTPTERLLTAAEFQRLADVPPEVEWFANLDNETAPNKFQHRSRRHLLL
jgi:integrase/recombinase XerD